MNRRRFLSLAGLGGLACLTSARPTAAQIASGVAVSPGVSPLEIRFGTTLGLSGPYGLQLFDYLQGFVTYVDEVNALGGVHNRRLTLLALDHGSEPENAVRNTLSFFGESDVFALVAYGAVAPLQRVLPILARSYFRPDARDPFLFGTWSAPASLFAPPYSGRLYSVRQSYEAEMEALVRYLEHSGERRIGLCHTADGTGFAVRDALTKAIAGRRLELIGQAVCDDDPESVGRAFDRLGREPLDRVVCAMGHVAVAEALRPTADRPPAPALALASTVAGEALLDLLERRGGLDSDLDLIQSRAVPTIHGDHPAAADMRELTQRRRTDRLAPWRPADAFQELPWTAAGLEGFLTGKRLVRALEQAGPDLGSGAFRRAWTTLQAGPTGPAGETEETGPTGEETGPTAEGSPPTDSQISAPTEEASQNETAHAVDPLGLEITLARAGRDGRWREIPFYSVPIDPSSAVAPTGSNEPGPTTDLEVDST